MSPARAAVFLDRDGVLNEAFVRGATPHPPANVDEVVLLPGVLEACRAFRAAGLLQIVVTNQPDIARGTTTVDAVDAINRVVTGPLAVDAVLVCPHDSGDGCECRKPRPGMLLQAAATHGIDLARSTMVGDRWRDIEAGQAAGVATVFIDHGYAERKPQRPDHVVGALIEAVPFVLERSTNRE